MAETSLIEWTDATWNPITGCSVLSPGCTNCYAMRLAGTRMQHHWSRLYLTKASKAGPVWNGQIRLNPEWLDKPLQWRRPRRIFVCAHSDLFHEHIPAHWIDLVWARMALAQHHTHQVLTKRSSNACAYLNDPEQPRRVIDLIDNMTLPTRLNGNRFQARHNLEKGPLPNIWLGVSAEDDERAGPRVADLKQTPAAVRFLSAEPLLAPIGDDKVAGLDWVIVGGESGPGARPMHSDWPRQIRDACAAAGVPFFFKQWGDWAPIRDLPANKADDFYHPAPERDPEAIRRCKIDHLVMHSDGSLHRGYGPEVYAGGTDHMLMFQCGKATAGRALDGITHDAMPALARAA